MSTLRVVPLGGAGEIGKNMIAYEQGEALLLVDCGLMFPDEEMLGVDIVIPDMSWIFENADRVVGLVLTHGHEDHIGAVPYLLRELDLPIWGTPLTLGLLAGKLREHGFAEDDVQLEAVEPGDRFDVGPFDVEFVHVCHSIPDCVAVVLHTPDGAVVQTADFKFDQTPVDDRPTDLPRLATLGDEGVLALLTDCTNVEKPGFTPSERTVGETFERVFTEATGRVIVATFASNLHRVQQVIDVSERHGRYVAVTGRSMVTNIEVAARLGYLSLPDGCLVELDTLAELAPERTTILTTGSQGEPLSALSLMARQDHRKLHIEPGDTVIVSASPIPGNEAAIYRTVNQLVRLGAELLYDEIAPVHVSGHGNQEDLKMMIHLLRPRFVVPYHGEHRHFAMFCKLADRLGFAPEEIALAQLGEVLELSPEGVARGEKVACGSVLIDGLGIGDVGATVLRDRRHLSGDGVVVCVVSVDSETGEVLAGPDLLTRGVVYARESGELLQAAKDQIRAVLNAFSETAIAQPQNLRSAIHDTLRRFLYAEIKRRPVVLPVIMEI